MIRFLCRCGHNFALDDDRAGDAEQCPQCSRLNDVPLLSDLAHLNPDGTYELGDHPLAANAGRLPGDAYVYSKGRRDHTGEEIDLRPSWEDIELAGDPPMGTPPAPPRRAPRYDPETGELIQPIEVKHDPVLDATVGEIPFAKATINYASPELLRRHSARTILVGLLSPGNLVVLGFMFIGHAFLFGIAQIYLMVYGGSAAFILGLQCILLGHYGNVIEETGPHDRDELPRPLRDLQWHDDIWSPFVNVMAALILSYAPARWAAVQPLSVSSAALELTMLLAGTIVFPAVLLTISTSGTVLNLRPDRILWVIRAGGPGYVVAVASWAGAAVCFAVALLGLDRVIGLPGRLPGWASGWLISLPLLEAAVYLMHFFCWQLGMLYRGHHPQFRWVLQEHVRRGPRVAGPTAAERYAQRRARLAARGGNKG